MEYVALDHATGMGVLFWGSLTPGKESDGLLPSSTPSYSIPVHVPLEAPGQGSWRHWCWVGRLWGFFRRFLRWGGQMRYLKVAQRGSRACGWEMRCREGGEKLAELRAGWAGQVVSTKAVRGGKAMLEASLHALGRGLGQPEWLLEPYRDGRFHYIPCQSSGFYSVCFQRPAGHPTCISHWTSILYPQTPGESVISSLTFPVLGMARPFT